MSEHTRPEIESQDEKVARIMHTVGLGACLECKYFTMSPNGETIGRVGTCAVTTQVDRKRSVRTDVTGTRMGVGTVLVEISNYEKAPQDCPDRRFVNNSAKEKDATLAVVPAEVWPI